MSEGSGSAFALGYLKGQSPTAHEGAVLLTRALRERQQPTVNVDTLLAAAFEMERLLEQKDHYIAALQQEINELRAHASQVEADRDKLIDWSERAQAELDWRRLSK